MAIDYNIDIDATHILKVNGLDNMGTLHKKICYEIIRNCDPYTPFDRGVLKGSARVELPYVTWNTPYARYMYYGKLMVDPNTKKGAFFNENYGFWSRKGVQKELTDTPLNYQGAPMRGSHWVERMWADKGQQILDGISHGGL